MINQESNKTLKNKDAIGSMLTGAKEEKKKQVEEEELE